MLPTLFFRRRDRLLFCSVMESFPFWLYGCSLRTYCLQQKGSDRPGLRESQARAGLCLFALVSLSLHKRLWQYRSGERWLDQFLPQAFLEAGGAGQDPWCSWSLGRQLPPWQGRLQPKAPGHCVVCELCKEGKLCQHVTIQNPVDTIWDALS